MSVERQAMDGVERIGDGDGPAERASRDSFFLSARLTLADSPRVHEGRVRNLSPGGLMVELERVAAPGTAVTLEIRGLGEMTGRVAWCAHGRIGVALDHPIDPARARLPVGGGGERPPVYGKPQLVPTPRRR